eukprot:3629276-Amphidinium_carterae.1
MQVPSTRTGPSSSWRSWHPEKVQSGIASSTLRHALGSSIVSEVRWLEHQSPPRMPFFVFGFAAGVSVNAAAALTWRQMRGRSKHGAVQHAKGGAIAGICTKWNQYWDEHKRLLKSAKEKKGGAASTKGATTRVAVPWKRLIQEFKAEARM